MDRLREYLDTNSIKYTVISHSKAYTALEVAALVHVPGQNVAKASKKAAMPPQSLPSMTAGIRFGWKLAVKAR